MLRFKDSGIESVHIGFGYGAKNKVEEYFGFCNNHDLLVFNT